MTLVDDALKKIRERKVIQLNDIADLLNCSIPTVRRRLKEWKTHTSYNKNGRYYTLSNIPKFDEYGIWKYKNILFSKNGNLKKTLIHHVDHSVGGLSVIQISNILCIPATNFLGHFKGDPSIQREKYKGVYIYFSKTPDIFKKQKREREEIIRSKAEMDLPSAVEAVTILVEFMKHSQDNIDQLTRRVRRKGVNVSITKIRSLLVYHDLLKKTQDFLSFEH